MEKIVEQTAKAEKPQLHPNDVHSVAVEVQNENGIYSVFMSGSSDSGVSLGRKVIYLGGKEDARKVADDMLDIEFSLLQKLFVSVMDGSYFKAKEETAESVAAMKAA